MFSREQWLHNELLGLEPAFDTPGTECPECGRDAEAPPHPLKLTINPNKNVNNDMFVVELRQKRIRTRGQISSISRLRYHKKMDSLSVSFFTSFPSLSPLFHIEERTQQIT